MSGGGAPAARSSLTVHQDVRGVLSEEGDEWRSGDAKEILPIAERR